MGSCQSAETGASSSNSFSILGVTISYSLAIIILLGIIAFILLVRG